MRLSLLHPLGLGLVSLLFAYMAGCRGGYWGGILGLVAGVMGMASMLIMGAIAYGAGAMDRVLGMVDEPELDAEDKQE